MKSLVAIAISYALRRWSALARYLDDGPLEIDNLVAELALRGVAIGAQLFVPRIKGGRRASRRCLFPCKLN
jgi:transposase